MNWSAMTTRCMVVMSGGWEWGVVVITDNGVTQRWSGTATTRAEAMREIRLVVRKFERPTCNVPDSLKEHREVCRHCGQQRYNGETAAMGCKFASAHEFHTVL